MENYIKKNIKYFISKGNKIADILEIKEQSIKNKLSDEKRTFLVEDLIKISIALNITIDDLIFKDLSNFENKF